MSDKIKTANVDTDKLDPTTVIGSGVYPSLGGLTRYGGVHFHSQDKEEPIYGGVHFHSQDKEDTGQLYKDIHIGMFDITRTGSGGFEGVSKKDSGIDATLKITHAKIPGSDNHRASIYTKLTFEGTKEEIEEMLRKIGDAVEK